MYLKLENVGKIQSADIKLDGITVIAGENNTGKSTVGKMLYCLFNSFYRIEDQVENERIKTIYRVVTNFYRETSNRMARRFDLQNLACNIVENKHIFETDIKKLQEVLKNYYLDVDSSFEKKLNSESLFQLSKRIQEFLLIEDDEIRKVILKKRLEAEFAMKVGHLNKHDEQSKIRLNIKNDEISFDVLNNEEICLNKFLSLVKDIIYIDNPFVLDILNDRYPFQFINGYDHGNSLIDKIRNDAPNKEFSALDELVVKKKFDIIFNTMNEICDGELATNDSGAFVYKTSKLKGNLDIVNLSTGMKSFIILRQLLINGSIDENGVIILDEPEIHLHPEWQLKFAEVIVLIQREFGVNILLNTHSPYFLNAIQVYSCKHSVQNKCNYYLTETSDMVTNIIDVTDNTELIYEKLANPLQELENMEYRYGSTV